MNIKNKDIISKIYNGLQKPVYKMAVGERCDLQKLLNKAIRMDDENRYLAETDRLNFEHHINQFESDIFLIESKTEERILTQAATIQIALNKISNICRDWQEGDYDED